MKILFTSCLSLLAFFCVAQQVRHDHIIPVTEPVQISSLKSLEARFVADKLQGAAPLTVKFTDQSSGNPTSWKWYFGDGDSSLAQHPTHTYAAFGQYTVKLSISDGINGFALEKKDYIKVTPNFLSCDTLHFPLPEPLTYYAIPGKGYVAGNNTYNDKGICDYFENMQPNLAITGMIYRFAKAKQTAGHNEKIPLQIWKSDPSTGKPGTLLRSDTVLLSTLVSDVTNGRLTAVDFDVPFQPGGSFFAGAMFPVLAGDTLAFWSTGPGKVPVNTAWILQSTNNWISAPALWTQQGGLIISNAVFPKVCLLNAIDDKRTPVQFAIWPNPAHDFITLVNQEDIKEISQYSISDLTGKILISGKISQSLSTAIDVQSLKPGIYLLNIKGTHTYFSSKLIIK